MSKSILFQNLLGNNIYWNGKGKHQAIYKAKQATLIPYDGKCETEEGEILRAVVALYYDYYNNGMCNNTSGPAKFLLSRNKKYNWGLDNELTLIYNNSNNLSYGYINLERELEAVCDKVMEYIDSHANTPNTEDMWDYADSSASDIWDNMDVPYDIDL